MGASVSVVGIGAAGEVAARMLSEQESIESIRLADIRRERLQHVADLIERDVTKARVDLRRPEDVRRACKGAEIVINSSLPPYNIPLMREALRIGAHYVDLASQGSPDPNKRSAVLKQMALDGAFRRSGLTAILGMGVAPGITNLLAKHAIREMDTVKTIRIRVFGSGYAEVEGHVFAPLFSPETFLEEVLWPAPVWKGDHIEKLRPFSGEEAFTFPDPLGVAICYNVNNEETETMPTYLGKPIRFIDFKYAIEPRRKALLEGLYRLGFTDAKPIRVRGKKVAPLDVLLALLPDASSLAGRARGHTCVVVEVEGSDEHGTRMWTIMDNNEAYKRMGATATAFLTGTPPVAATLALMSGEIGRKGVTTGGGLDPPPLIRRLLTLGVPLFEGEIGGRRGEPLEI